MSTIELLRFAAMALADLPVTSVVPHIRFGERVVTGTHVVFANGCTLSIQWHSGNYSSIGRNQDGPPTFEVAAWYPDGKWVKLDDRPDDWCEDVAGWQTIAQVMEHARNVSALEALEHPDLRAVAVEFIPV